MVVHSLKRTGRKDFRTNQWLILMGCACILAGLGLLARVLTTEPERVSASFETTRIGSIEMNGANGQCKRFKFYNSNGLISPDRQSCDSANGHEGSMPTGTNTRLTAISNSFSKK
jgi:hypothetical protein